MSTKRNPIYVFGDDTSIGIFGVPIGSLVQVIDAGGGTPSFTQILDKTGFVDTTPISQYLASSNYATLDKDTTYGIATTGTDGLMSSADFSKLAGIAPGAGAALTKSEIEAMGIDAASVTGKTIAVSVPTGALFTDTVYNDTALIADIAANASGIAANVMDIATNTTNIATNTANIGTNAANIATNVTDIATNATDITTAVGDLDLKANIAGQVFTGAITATDITAQGNLGIMADADIIGKLNVVGGATIDADTTLDNLIINGTIDGPVAGAGTPGLVSQGASVANSTGSNVAANTTTINNLLISLRAAGIIA